LNGTFFFSDLGPVPILERDSKLSQSGMPRDRIKGGTVENREAKSWCGPCSVLCESRMASCPAIIFVELLFSLVGFPCPQAVDQFRR
jgi:hypothetical protein